MDSQSPLPGTLVKNRYHLEPKDAAWFAEIRSIKSDAQDRLAVLHQKIQDCDRLIEGRMTQVKWDKGWSEGDIVAYDARAGDVLCLEVIRE